MRDRVIYRNLTLVAAPVAGDALSLEDAKHHLRVTWDDENARIEALIQAATAYLDGRDGILGRALMTQTWEYTVDAFPVCDAIELPLPPVQSITSITYRDVNGNPATFSASDYSLSDDKQWRPRILLAAGASWPGTDGEPEAVTIRAVHGYGDALESVPMPIRQAMLLLIGHWYVSREAVNISTELPLSAEALLAPYMLTTF